MGWPRYLLGMLATIGALLLGVSLECSIGVLFSPSAFLAVVVGSVGLLFATFPAQHLLSGFRIAARRQQDLTPEERALALVVLSAAMRYPCGLGAL